MAGLGLRKHETVFIVNLSRRQSPGPGVRAANTSPYVKPKKHRFVKDIVEGSWSRYLLNGSVILDKLITRSSNGRAAVLSRTHGHWSLPLPMGAEKK